MRRVRLVVAVLAPIEVLLYVPPRGVTSPLDPLLTSITMVAALVAIDLASWLVHRRETAQLARVARIEVAADAVVVLGILQLFAFDQFSSIWTILIIVLLEAAFRGGLRGAVTTWAA